MRKLIVLLVLLLVFWGVWSVVEQYGVNLNILPNIQNNKNISGEKIRVVSEESEVIDIVNKVSPSVVTVGIEQNVSPADPFNFFNIPQQTPQQREQDIGSGFVVETDGLIVTNKHVVSTAGQYKVITHDGKKYDVKSIYRDSANDVAVIKIDAKDLKPVVMGDSSKVKVGKL